MHLNKLKDNSTVDVKTLRSELGTDFLPHRDENRLMKAVEVFFMIPTTDKKRELAIFFRLTVHLKSKVP